VDEEFLDAQEQNPVSSQDTTSSITSDDPFGVEKRFPPSAAVYVGNIAFEAVSEDLEKGFGAFGPIKSSRIATDVRGLSKGFGYIEFETVEQATAAIAAKNATVFEGRRIVVNYQAEPTKPRVTNPPSKVLFIGNIAFEMTDADLNKLFRDVPGVFDVRVAVDRRTGQPRGFCHAEFVDAESATAGLNFLQGKEVLGRPLRLDYSSTRPRYGTRGINDGKPKTEAS